MKELSDTDPEARLREFERRSAVPMFALSLLLVPMLVIPLIVPLDAHAWRILDTIDWLIWAGFAVEYGIRLSLARDRIVFVSHNLIDLAIVVLPLMRPLRFAASARSMRFIQAGRIVTAGLRGGKLGGQLVNGRNVSTAALVAMLLVTGAAALEYDAEHLAAGSNIRTVGDAFWWAIVTVSSVGYGDRYPVTVEGRLIAAGLMVIGILTNGLVAAAFASVFISSKEEQHVDPRLDSIDERLARLDMTIAKLDRHLEGPA